MKHLDLQEQARRGRRRVQRGRRALARRGRPRRQELLAVADSNLAALSARSGMPQPALDFCMCAEEHEHISARMKLTTFYKKFGHHMIQNAEVSG